MIQALELRAAGASFRQIGEALSVSKPRAFRIVRKALNELVQHCQAAPQNSFVSLQLVDSIPLPYQPSS